VLNPSLLNPAPQGNIDLIKLGGIPLSNANELVQSFNLLDKTEVNSASESLSMTVEEPPSNYRTQSDEVRDRILDILKEFPLSINDIIEKAKLDWTAKKAVAYLKKMDEIEVVKKGRSNYYKRKNVQAQPRLFA
jgi:predicted Rossmann fold nucleotide-binding protein DprA/Smf involved in DNA uptake